MSLDVQIRATSAAVAAPLTLCALASDVAIGTPFGVGSGILAAGAHIHRRREDARTSMDVRALNPYITHRQGRKGTLQQAILASKRSRSG
jgi:hypothetical protein